MADLTFAELVPYNEIQVAIGDLFGNDDSIDEITRLEENLGATQLVQDADEVEDDEEILDLNDWRNKVKKLLYRHNCEYKKHRSNKSSVNWLCKTEGCPASVTIDSLDKITYEFTIQGQQDEDLDEEQRVENAELVYHNHMPLDLPAIEILIAEGILEQRSRHTTTSLKQIYDEVAVQLEAKVTADGIARKLREFKKLQPAMKYQRAKFLLKNPRTAAEIVMSTNQMSTKDTPPLNFLLFDTKDEDRIIAFASLSGLDILSKADQWHVDGTFHASPKIFYQAFIIHAWSQCIMIPCVFVLLRNKTEATYIKLLRELKTAGRAQGKHFNPTWLMTDFELAIHNAFRSEFTSIRIKGCVFHFTQAIWRNIQTIGLSKMYKQKESYSTWFKQVMCLAFVPEEQLVQAHAYLLENKPSRSALMTKFLKYFQNTWMEGNFPTKVWNHSNTTGPRTNNHIEGFHSALNRSMGFGKPNLHKVIEKFQNLEALAKQTFIRVDRQFATAPNRKPDDIEKDLRLYDAIERVRNDPTQREWFFSMAIQFISDKK